jgi:hypothetical protein
LGTVFVTLGNTAAESFLNGFRSTLKGVGQITTMMSEKFTLQAFPEFSKNSKEKLQKELEKSNNWVERATSNLEANKTARSENYSLLNSLKQK